MQKKNEIRIESKISGERVMWVVITPAGSNYNCSEKSMAEKVKKALEKALDM